MLKFAEYLIEKTNLEGNIGTERKGIRHLVNYVAPYLSSEQRAHLSSNFSEHIPKTKIKTGNGEKFNPDTKSPTHELSSDINGFKAGTPVRVTGARHDKDGRIFVQTANHGEVQMSKLQKPGELKRENITKGGFEVESKIAKNLGTEAAGSTGSAYDYSYRGEDGGIVGKARKIESDKPFLRGESKQNKANMGVSSLKFNSETGWNFTHEKLGKKFADAVHTSSGLNILDHLNKFHKDGKIAKGFSIKAPTGMARAYLENLGVNSLHLHRTEKATKRKEAIDHGTTYTIGDKNELKGKTNLGHLSSDDIDKLDGTLTIEGTTNGATRIAHKPDYKTFKEYADNSQINPDNHSDLTNEEHAKSFRKHIDTHLNKPKRRVEKRSSMIGHNGPPSTPEEDSMTNEGGREPPIRSSNEMWGQKFHSDDESRRA